MIHELTACSRVPGTEVRYQHGGDAVSDIYQCPNCKRQGRFLQARIKGVACDGRRFSRDGNSLQMEVARLRAEGRWPLSCHEGDAS